MATNYRIVDAVYGPPLHEVLPPSYSHRLPQELQRRVVPQLKELLVGPLVLPAGSLNSIFGDPAPLLTKELRIAVTDGHNSVHVATFNECESISFTSLEFLWKQSPPVHHTPAPNPNPCSPPKKTCSSEIDKTSRIKVGAGKHKGWEWPLLSGSLPFMMADQDNGDNSQVIEVEDVSLVSRAETTLMSTSSLSSSSAITTSNFQDKKDSDDFGEYCYIDLITRRGVAQKLKSTSDTSPNTLKRPRSSSFSLSSSSSLSSSTALCSPPPGSSSSSFSVVPLKRDMAEGINSEPSSSFIYGDIYGNLVDREEEILLALLDFLGFRERVASSAVSTTWHVVFYFAGACRAIHTDLPVFRGCSTRFLLGALEHSKQSLSVCGLVGRTDLLPVHFTTMVLPLSRLVMLDLSRCELLTTACLESMMEAESLPLLQVLYLKELACLNDEIVTLLAQSFQKLTCFDISACPLLTGTSIKQVGLHLPLLRMFNISDLRNNFTGNELYHLLNNAGAKGLHTLSLYGCNTVSSLGQVNEDVKEDAGFTPHSPSNSYSLKRVNSFNSSMPSSPSSLHRTSSFSRVNSFETLNDFHTAPLALLPLTCINLFGCHNLEDSALEPLVHAKHLRYFNASYCHRLTDSVLSLLASFAFELEHLDLTCLPLLTDTGLGTAKGNLRKLRSLAIGHCRQVTTEVLIAFVMETSQLTELRLEYCRKINARTFLGSLETSVQARNGEVDAVSQRIPRLDLIDLRGCGGLSSSGSNWGGRSSKLGVSGFTEPRPGFLRRLPPSLPVTR